MRRGSEVPRKRIIEFLEKKGSVHVIEVIGTDGSPWSTLAEEIDISPSTLTKRLVEAEELELIEEVIDESESRGNTKYKLTRTLGEQIFHQMMLTQLKATARSLRHEARTFQEQKEELVEWVEDGDLDTVYTEREKQEQTNAAQLRKRRERVSEESDESE